MKTLMLCLLLAVGTGCATTKPDASVPTWSPTRDDGTPIPDPRGMDSIPDHPTRPI